MDSSPDQPRAVVVGSTGGIGRALVLGLEARGYAVTGLARSPVQPGDPRVDITDEASIAAAAQELGQTGPISRIIVATGILSDDTLAPEKSLRELDGAKLLRLFAVNTVGPALLAKHFVPLLPRDRRATFALLSARVGSIGDNRLGGWYGYRASKAALNMLIKTLAIEVARTRPLAVCAGLHPGTVNTRLSRPFQRNVPAERLFTPAESAEHLLEVLDGLGPEASGRCFAWDGTEIVP